MKHNLNQAAIGIVFNQQKDQVLLVKRRDVPVWVLPGGGIDENEKPESAVVREVQEETGLIVSIQRQTAIYTPINRLSKVTHVYECVVNEGTLSTGDETRELAFFPLDELPNFFFFVHRDWLMDAKKNSSTVILKSLSQVTYCNLFIYFCCHPWHVLRFAMSRFGMPMNSK